MPCRIGHEAGDPSDLYSMSRRDLLGISGISALTLASGAAASLLVAGCNKKADAETKVENYVPCLGMIALYPATVHTFEDADKTPLREGDKCFYLPYYSEYLDKKDLKKGTKLTCRVLLLGNPAIAAMAVNVSTEQFLEQTHDTAHKNSEELDNILIKLGYRRPYLNGSKFVDLMTSEECDKKCAEKIAESEEIRSKELKKKGK